MTIRFETRVAAADIAPHNISGRAGTTMLAAVIGQIAVQKLELTNHERNRSRLACLLPDGQGAAIILPARDSLQPGDRLLSACGHHCVEIVAASEPLMCIEAQTPFALMRLVYHLANRHVPAMLMPQAILIEPDVVLADMVLRLGGSVTRVKAPFIPESGAYAGPHDHVHSHAREDVSEHHRLSHGHHSSEDPMDAEMGRIGEMLSRQAHAPNQAKT